MFMRFFETDTKEIKRFLFTHRKNYQQMWSILNILDCVKGHFSHGFFFKSKYRNLRIFLRLGRRLSSLNKKYFDKNLAYNSN